MKSEPLLSIVIPVYNSESKLQRCLDSVRNQTYRNIELILVDDGSPGPIKKLMTLPENSDIIFHSHESNKGLFQARLTGSLKARGDFIAFLDSDDFVSRDFYRTLMFKALDENLDIVAGRTIFREADGSEYIRNLHEAGFGNETITGIDVRNRFFKQAGSCFAWHTVWNKIYKKTLWDRCVPYYKKMPLNTIMTEDIAFSSLLFYNAQSFAYVPNEGIRYCNNEGSSTDSSEISIEEFIKNIDDMNKVFDFVDDYLSDADADEDIRESFLNFRKFYSRIWRSLQEQRFIAGGNRINAHNALNRFLPGYDDVSQPEEHYFEIFKTPYDPTTENIKNIIIDEKIEVISFDIFDTLILRPFYKPDDIFLLMDKEYAKEHTAGSPFSVIRKNAEIDLRSLWGKNTPNQEDFPLSAIYEHIVTNFRVPEDVAMRMYSLENELEIKYCYERKYSKDLYLLSNYLKKRIVLISDMYLEFEIVSKILEKNGFDKHEKLFLSSSEGKLKYSGQLYECALSYLKTSPKKIVHIGDNWNVDFKMSQKLGFIPIFIPKPINSMENKVQNVSTNDLGFLTDSVIGKIISSEQLKKSISYRTYVSLVANEYFDNPYVSFNSESIFNFSPGLIGMYPLGMHTLGLCKYLLDISKKYDSKKIILLSRDGYLLHNALNGISEFVDVPCIEYIPCSRNALLPWMICSTADFFDLPISALSHSPSSISSLLGFCSKADCKELILESGYDRQWTERFNSQEEYFDFIKRFIKYCYSKEKHESSKQIVSDFYKSKIPKDSIVFDMGYSGRIPAALSRAVGWNVKYVYVCSDTDSCDRYLGAMDIELNTIYPILPHLSGALREFFLSGQEGTCLGFEYADNRIVPVLDETERTYTQNFAVTNMQGEALKMVQKYFFLFGEYVSTNGDDVFKLSLPFESMLCDSKNEDMTLLMASYSDDYLYGGVEKINMYDFWKWALADSEKGRVALHSTSHENKRENIKNTTGFVDFCQNTFYRLYSKFKLVYGKRKH